MTRVAAILVVLATGSAFAAASAVGETIKVGNNKFRPDAVTVEEGERITWRGVRGFHNVTFKRSPFRKRKLDRNISSGERLSKRTRREGRFRYVCAFHAQVGMRGKVIVE
jgi:plastocyanin